MIDKPYFEKIHLDSSITDIKNFCDQDGISIAFYFLGREKELMDYAGDTKITNRERVKSQYDNKEIEDNKGKTDADLLLKINTKILIPKDKLQSETILTEGNQVVETNSFTAFLGDQLKNFLQDPKYRIVNKLNKGLGVTKEIFPQLTVWMWCRALSNNSDDELNGSLIDISHFIQSISINSATNGGNFNITLCPLICEPDVEKGWIIKKATIQNYHNNSLKNNYVAHSNLHKIDNSGNLKRNQFFFHNIISSNDMVFIRFETLESEIKDRARDENKFSVDKKDLSGKIYDMIGLVDTNAMLTNPASNEVGINISGRDLTKLLIEDGCYFYPLEFAGNRFAQNQDNDRLLNRIYGKVETLAVNSKRSIEFSIRFVLNQLANLGVTPDNLFDSYSSGGDILVRNGDRRSTFFRKSDDPHQAVEKRMQGIYQIIKLIIDPSVRDLRIVDSSISTELGSILNSINKICQQPFVEFSTDTYGDMFYLIVRRLPFNEDAFKQLIYGGVITERGLQTTNGSKELVIDIEEEDIISEQLSFDDNEVYSWYKLTPQGTFYGEGQKASLAYLPAVYFSEYADIWGSRPLDMVTNYVLFSPNVGGTKDDSLNRWERQAFRDLKYMVDIHSYLPFTRKGGLVINGDRRIKKGTTVRLKSTGEIFYVDAVSNDYQISDTLIDRRTTLEVSRGMVEKYIKGVEVRTGLTSRGGGLTKISYFNIINTEIDESFFVSKKDTVDGDINQSLVNVLSNWKVNKDVFNFFVKRNQFK